MFDLSNKVAIITGGNGGIGLGIAKGMAQNGARIVIAGRNRGKTEKAIEQLDTLGIEALGLEVDVQSEKSIAEMIEKSLVACGHIDILVNNAGVNLTKFADQFTVNDWRQVIDINLIGTYLPCREVYRHMLSNGGGKIINIGSVTAIFGSKRSLPYAASKSGLIQLTRSLAVAWADDNIQANVILPGWVETEMTAELRESEDAEIKHIYHSITDRIPAGRWAKPDDIAGAAVFLASRASDYITGTVIAVDGGYSIA
jgi:2-deoxy-D-gluconate 3-dehydrogenase